jgi:hypothetical protein
MARLIFTDKNIDCKEHNDEHIYKPYHKTSNYIHMCTIKGNNQPTLLVKAEKTKKKKVKEAYNLQLCGVLEFFAQANWCIRI